jgi:flagellar protein FliO/FliZ
VDTSLAALLVRVVVSLGVVLVVMWGAATVLRRSGVAGTAATGRRGGKRTAPLEVIARRGLSRGASVMVVRLGGRALVLGVTEQNVSVLAEVDPAELDAPGLDPGADDHDAGSSDARTAGPGIGSGSLPWKVALEQLRERTVRRS